MCPTNEISSFQRRRTRQFAGSFRTGLIRQSATKKEAMYPGSRTRPVQNSICLLKESLGSSNREQAAQNGQLWGGYRVALQAPEAGFEEDKKDRKAESQHSGSNHN